MWWSVALGVAMAVMTPADALSAEPMLNRAAELQREPRPGASANGERDEARLVGGMAEATPKTKAQGHIPVTKKPVPTSEREFCDSFKQR